MTRRHRRDRAAASTSWWDRLMLSFMGPPQLGEHRAPAGYTPDPQADLCPKCGRPWDAHERVDTGSRSYLRCPQPEG